MKIKKSLQELYNQVVSEIEIMRRNTLKGKGAGTDKTTEQEKIDLSKKESKEFRAIVFELLNK